MVEHKYQGDRVAHWKDPIDWKDKTVELNTANGRFPSGASEPQEEKPDMVDHPPHYNQGTMEAIDMIEAAGLDYHRSNALKYLIRSPYKGSEKEDLLKAIWYIQRYIRIYIDNE